MSHCILRISVECQKVLEDRIYYVLWLDRIMPNANVSCSFVLVVIVMMEFSEH